MVSKRTNRNGIGNERNVERADELTTNRHRKGYHRVKQKRERKKRKQWKTYTNRMKKVEPKDGSTQRKKQAKRHGDTY